MMERTIRVDAADYLSRALAEIDDLTGDTREDLKDSIESAVIEVAAEFPDDLELLLGPPEKFATELRIAAGVDPAPTRRLLSSDALGSSLRWVDGRWSSLESHRWVQWVTTLARELRPAWWVIRSYGWLVAAGLVTTGYFTLDWVGPLPIPRIFSAAALGPFVLLAAVVSSVELGRRSQLGWRRVAVTAANALAIVMLLGTAAEVSERIGYATYEHAVAEVAYPLVEADDLVAARVFGVPIAGIEVHHANGEALFLETPELENIDEILGYPTVGEITVHTVDGRSTAFDSIDSFREAVHDGP